MGAKKRFWIGFSLVPGIGASRLRSLLAALGDVEAAWSASKADLRRAGLAETYARALVETRTRIDLDEEVEKVEKSGFQVLTWDDDSYPERLREIDTPPPVLYVWGNTVPQDRWAVAIVGTRKKSPYGVSVAEDISAYLAANGVTVVSGMARGIDAVAHEAALAAGGRTLAVLGSGLDQIYPPEHRGLAERIAANGAVMSDYAMGTAPEGRNFPPRNRIISGLSLAVVVVEAGQSSGALITAGFAADQGREVLAVPGNINSPASRGTNRLIASGAYPLTSREEVLEVLNMEAATRHEMAQLELPEGESERRVFEELGLEPLHVDELQARCAMPIAKVSAALSMLELKGRVRQVGGMHYVRVRETGGKYIVE